MNGPGVAVHDILFRAQAGEKEPQPALTYQDFRLAVLADVADRTGWSSDQAANTIGDRDEAHREGVTVADAATETIWAATAST